MSDYRYISLQDLDEALFNVKAGRYRSAAFYFQQFAEKSVKALLEKIDPDHKQLKSHNVEKILEAYDTVHATSELGDKARYLTSFYFNTRYPGDNYTEVSEDQILKAKACSEALEEYISSELERMEESKGEIANDVETLPKITAF